MQLDTIVEDGEFGKNILPHLAIRGVMVKNAKKAFNDYVNDTFPIGQEAHKECYLLPKFLPVKNCLSQGSAGQGKGLAVRNFYFLSDINSTTPILIQYINLVDV